LRWTAASLSLWPEIFCIAAEIALNIEDPAAEKSVRELAAATGKTITTAIRRAAERSVRSVFDGETLHQDLPRKSWKLESGAPHSLISTNAVPMRFSVMTSTARHPDGRSHKF
jgi:hypothetical protein